MTLAPLLAAPAVVQIHTAAALVGLVAVGLQWAGAKSGLRHRSVGWAFVVAMAVTAVSSLGIRGVNHGQFSPIHIVTVVTLVNLPIAVWARRVGNIRLHKRTMIGLTAGLVGAGLFTLLPSRILGRVVFGL